MPYSEERQWWSICWNLSAGRIEIAQNIFETMDVVDIFEKYAIKLSLEYIPREETDGS